jgi:hypothetical protein
MKRLQLFILVLLAAFGVLVPRASADVTVYVGYADSLRPSPFFPVGFGLGASLTGISSGITQVFTGGGVNFDSGAILIVNTGVSSITLDSLSATVPTWTTNPLPGNTASTANTWASFASITLMPGNGAIFTQTTTYNFDTSDIGLQSPLLDQTNNCDPTNAFAIANPSVCGPIAPRVTISVNGTLLPVFTDTGQVLDTGGFDLANASTLCPGEAVPLGNCNESLQWRSIGTTGIGNPGGVTPEPASLLLMGSGLLGLAGLVRKKLQA